ncbi:16S rRNA (cytidine(1402)-2'-O)-methyltransferase [Ideonella sp. 4Y16]|uniref:16S rRNA (cytidine(1402)-2'-O)-methyltransferase n=1 Tax=Ideonella alba TaxID=2824118 RepID=UPI001B391E9F|nr:16S rRNA (cytidine(1402)-2'-O)-methyltransferase [Ideonella alba]MBQ0943230.1 16S rRNA (cytidine(1402)-2'-O)-methyltransferase [Ideonella alba]
MSLPASELLATARQAAGHQHWPTGALYVVATPIGNLADFTLRAIHALALADAVACEDTRVSAGLLRHLGLDKPLLAVHEHNEREAAERVLERLARGERVAYVSDAGTPAISDPGAWLVARARAAGHPVHALPGASAVVTALSAAGDGPLPGQTGGFVFAGFLPAKGRERGAALAALAAEPRSVVLFEAPHRIEALAQALAQACAARPVTLCRELTKQFEQVHTAAAEALPAWLAEEASRRRGEFVVVLHAQMPAAAADTGLAEPVRRQLQVLVRELPLKQAVALAVELSGLPRNQLYDEALRLKSESD